MGHRYWCRCKSGCKTQRVRGGERQPALAHTIEKWVPPMTVFSCCLLETEKKKNSSAQSGWTVALLKRCGSYSAPQTEQAVQCHFSDFFLRKGKTTPSAGQHTHPRTAIENTSYFERFWALSWGSKPGFGLWRQILEGKAEIGSWETMKGCRERLAEIMGLPCHGGGRVQQATRRISQGRKGCCFNEYDQLFLISGGVTRLNTL